MNNIEHHSTMEHLDSTNLIPLQEGSQNMPRTDRRALVMKRLKEKITRNSAQASPIGHSEVGRIHQTVQHSYTNVITVAESCNFQYQNKGISQQQVIGCSNENTKPEAIPPGLYNGLGARVHQTAHLNSANITSLDAYNLEYQPCSMSDRNTEQPNVQRSNVSEVVKNQADGLSLNHSNSLAIKSLNDDQIHGIIEDPRGALLQMPHQTDLNQFESLNQANINHTGDLIDLNQTCSSFEGQSNAVFQTSHLEDRFQSLTNQTDQNSLVGNANQTPLRLEVGDEVSQNFDLISGMQSMDHIQDEDLVLHQTRRDIETVESFIRGQCPLSFIKTEVQVQSTDVLSPESPALQKENLGAQELNQSPLEPSALQRQNLRGQETNQSPSLPFALQKQNLSGQEPNQSPSELFGLQKQNLSGQVPNQSPTELCAGTTFVKDETDGHQEPNQTPTKLCADTPCVKDETDRHQEPKQAPTEDLCSDTPFVKCETDGSQIGSVLMHQAGNIASGSSDTVTSMQNSDRGCDSRLIRLKRSGSYSHTEDAAPAAKDVIASSCDEGHCETGESSHEDHTSGKTLPRQMLASLQIVCQKLPYCDQCHLAFSTQSDFVKHGRKIHPQCRYCQKTFKYSSTLPDHEKGCRHLYTCFICLKIFHKVIRRIQHDLTHRVLSSGVRKIYKRRLESIQCPVSKAYMCWVCGKRFTKYSSCWRHKYVYHPHRNRVKSGRKVKRSLGDRDGTMHNNEAEAKDQDDDKEPSEIKTDFDDQEDATEMEKIHVEAEETTAAKNGRSSVEKNHLEDSSCIENNSYRLRNRTDGIPTICDRESAQLQTIKDGCRNSQKNANTLNTCTNYADTISKTQDKRMSSDNLTCKICRLSFKRSFNLKRHMLLHSNKKVKCYKCGRGFTRLDNMKSHQVGCHRACRYCRDSFSNKEECDRHEESCTAIVIYNARAVQKVAHESETGNGEEEMEGMSKRNDSGDDWTPTGRDAGSDSSDDDFQTETKQATKSNDHTCTVCGKCFDRKHLLNHHMLSHSVKRQFVCSKCSKSFLSKYHLKRHETFCKRSCRFCRKKFDCEEECTTHEDECIVALHFDDDSKRGVSFHGDSRHSNSDHGNDKDLGERSHHRSHGNGDSSTVCKNLKFTSVWIGDDDDDDNEQKKMGDTLNTNYVNNINKTQDKPMNSDNDGNDEQVIEEIAKMKDTDEDWTPASTGTNAGSDSSDDDDDDFQTEKKQATKSDEYVCTTCGMSFGRKHLLNRHMLKHSDKRQFVCSKCSKSFYRTDSWKRHEKYCKYSCRFCRKKFVCEEECTKHEERCIVGLHCDDQSKDGVSFHGDSKHGNSNHGNEKDLNVKSPNSCHGDGDSGIVGNNHNKFTSAWISGDDDNDDQEVGDIKERRDGDEVRQGQSSIHLCKLCGSTFARHHGLLRHLRTHMERAYRCQKCGKIIKSKDQLVVHQLACVDNFSCKYCNAEFNSSKDGFVHERVHESHLYIHKCKYCAREFKDRKKCNEHEKRHHCDHVICDTCGKSCKSKELLWYHMKAYHKPKEHLCSYCGEAFTTNALMRTHETRMHRQNDVVSFKCETCGKSFKYKEYLTRHVKLSHTNATKPYLCQHCGHRTNSKPHLRDHMRKHFAPTHKCRFCDKRFTKKELLKYHEATHTGFKAYKCRFCESSFTSPNGRLMHEKLHKNEKKHECRICSKRFNLPQHLNQHMKVHSEERPHKCEICGAGFKIRHHLAQHMGTHNKTVRKKY